MEKINLKISINSLTKIRGSLLEYINLVDLEITKGSGFEENLTRRQNDAKLAMSELMSAIAE